MEMRVWVIRIISALCFWVCVSIVSNKYGMKGLDFFLLALLILIIGFFIFWIIKLLILFTKSFKNNKSH